MLPHGFISLGRYLIDSLDAAAGISAVDQEQEWLQQQRRTGGGGGNGSRSVPPGYDGRDYGDDDSGGRRGHDRGDEEENFAYDDDDQDLQPEDDLPFPQNEEELDDVDD